MPDNDWMSLYTGLDLSERAELHRSALPEWIIMDLGEGDILVTCPRVGGRCGHGAIVNKDAWLRPGEMVSEHTIGRVCTYCFKTSKIPRLATGWVDTNGNPL